MRWVRPALASKNRPEKPCGFDNETEEEACWRDFETARRLEEAAIDDLETWMTSTAKMGA